MMRFILPSKEQQNNKLKSWKYYWNQQRDTWKLNRVTGEEKSWQNKKMLFDKYVFAAINGGMVVVLIMNGI